jgi:hypothetical protein
MRSVVSAFAALAFLAVSAFAQEASAPQTPTTKQSKGTVYVYRYKQFVGSALEPSVYCDETQLARMDNGRYFAVTVEPGKHTFYSNDKQAGLALDVKPGEKYFVRVELVAGMMKGHGRLTLMAPEQGSYELASKKLKPLDANKVVDHDRVSIAQFSSDNTTTASNK